MAWRLSLGRAGKEVGGWRITLRRSQIAAGVLAGGRGKRFGGRPKWLLKVAPGICTMEKQVAELARSGTEEMIILANNPLPYKAFGSKIVPDLRSGTGPLGGIETAVAHYASRFKATLFLPCNLPGITARQIRILKEGFVRTRAGVAIAVTEGDLREPLCAVLDNRLLPAISRAIVEGKRKVGEVWQSLEVAFVYFSDPEPFFNVSPPMDLICWLAGQGRVNRSRHTRGRRGRLSFGKSN